MKTSGDLFIKYLGIGLVLLASLIIGTRLGLFDISGTSSGLLLATGIIFVTLFCVFGYAAAILRDSELLRDQDAPDLAYYLGFSLTVAALSLTFLSDLIVTSSSGSSVNAQEQGQLVSRSLAQFGSGLLATLFGLGAKIFLASKQASQSSDPTVLYQQFRIEVEQFRQMMNQSASELKNGIEVACSEIGVATNTASSAVIKLSNQLEVTSKTLSESLNSEKISLPIENFIKELGLLGKPAQTLTNEFKQLSVSIEESQTALSILNASTSKHDKAQTSSASSLEKLTVATSQLTDISSALLTQLADLTETSKVTQEDLSLISKNAKRLSTNLSLVSDATERLSTSSNVVNESLVAIAPNLTSNSVELQVLNAAVTAAGNSLVQISKQSDTTSTSLTHGSESITIFSDQIKSSNDSVVKLSQGLADLNAAFEVDRLAAENSAKAYENQSEKLASLSDSILKTRDSQIDSSNAINRLIETSKILAQQSLSLQTSFTDLQLPIDKSTLSTKEFVKSVDSVSNELAKLQVAIGLVAANATSQQSRPSFNN
jgi:hypothetical protein